MPVSTSPAVAERFGDADHWLHVQETLFAPAIRKAGFEPVSPVSSGSEMIHATIIKELQSCDMVLCDLSEHNPNVFFELGVRTALNRPVALVAEHDTRLPFDISSVNTAFYSPQMNGWEVAAIVDMLAEHVSTSASKSEGQNPLWRAFGLTIQGTEAPASDDPTAAKVDLILRELSALKVDVALQEPVPATREFQDWASGRPALVKNFRAIGDDEPLPKWLAPFWQAAQVFTTEQGGDLRAFYSEDDPRGVFLKSDDLAGMNLASRRALMEMAREHGLAIVEMP